MTRSMSSLLKSVCLPQKPCCAPAAKLGAHLLASRTTSPAMQSALTASRDTTHYRAISVEREHHQHEAQVVVVHFAAAHSFKCLDQAYRLFLSLVLAHAPSAA